jgi:transmembrane sensor
MAANSEHIIGLLERYSGGQATAGEIDQLFTLLRSGDYDDTVVSFIETQLQTFEPDNSEDIAFWQSRLEGGAHRITGGTATENHSAVAGLPVDARPVHRIHFMRKWGWAAAAVVLLGIGAYLWNANMGKTKPAVAVTPAVITPGKNGAVLTLADGSQLVLDSLGNGVVADQNGTQVVLKGGTIAYEASGSAKGEVAYNTMTTPKGRQFRVTLPDGTGVWLNAASSISYPTVFAGNERKVTITGEVYFEVVKNARMPFKVNVNNKTEVEVLGTHFNVKAYDNETAIRTTLLEGAVKVGQSAMLKPGDQAVFKKNSPLTIDHSPDIDKVMAWKNGLFNFEGASFAEIMRQLERWYDIEVTYEKGVPNIEFEGKMTRDVPLNDLLKMLERSDIHFKIEGRKLIVLP